MDTQYIYYTKSQGIDMLCKNIFMEESDYVDLYKGLLNYSLKVLKSWLNLVIRFVQLFLERTEVMIEPGDWGSSNVFPW